MSEHSHPADGRTWTLCDACRQRAIDANALAEIASKAIEAADGGRFVHLGLRYGVAWAVLDSDWLAEHDERIRAEARAAALDEAANPPPDPNDVPTPEQVQDARAWGRDL